MQLQTSISEKGLAGTFTYIKCDLRNEQNILELFKTIEQQFGGRLAVLINNAGLANNAPLSTTSDTDGWREMLDVNVLSMALVQREGARLMKTYNEGRGTIINISSISGHRLSPGGASGHFYSATKHAVRVLSEGMRREMRTAGPDCTIRVSMISPGAVETEFFNRFHGEEKGKQFLETSPHLKPEDIATLVITILALPEHVSVDDIIVRPTLQSF